MGLVEMRCTLRVRGMGGKYPFEISEELADHTSVDRPKEAGVSFKFL